MLSSSPFFSFMPSVLAVLLLCNFINIFYVSAQAAKEFKDFLQVVPWRVAVSRSPDLDGPVDVLLPPGFDATTLSQPTTHQIWWGLVPGNQLNVVQQNVDGIQNARWWLSIVNEMVLVIHFTNMYDAFFKESSVDQPKRMRKIWQSLFGASLSTFSLSTIFCSMYTIYMDPNLELPVLNYVPGWAYIISELMPVLIGMLVSMTMLISKSMAFILAIFLLIYWLFWIFIPLLGYTYYFAWSFVDDVAAQEVEKGGIVDTGITADGAEETIKLLDEHAIALGDSFAFSIYTALITAIISSIGLVLSRGAEIAIAASQEAATEVRTSIRRLSTSEPIQLAEAGRMEKLNNHKARGNQ